MESKETSQHFLELRRGEMKIINNFVTSIFSLPSLSKRGEGACEGGKWSGLDQDPHQGGVEGRMVFVCPQHPVQCLPLGRCAINTHC